MDKFFLLLSFFLLAHLAIMCSDHDVSNKLIASFNIKSSCFWAKSLEHNPSICTFCTRVNIGTIEEKHQLSPSNYLIITRKPSFEPMLFFGCFIISSLKKSMPKNNIDVDELKKQEGVWLHNKNVIVKKFEEILLRIDKYKYCSAETNMTNDIPEFIEKNECIIKWYSNKNNYSNYNYSILDMKGENKPIKIYDKVVVPKNEFNGQLYVPQNSKLTHSVLRLGYLLSLFTMISSPAVKSKLLYKPNVKMEIIQSLLERVKSLSLKEIDVLSNKK